jgi:hypothetical protein
MNRITQDTRGYALITALIVTAVTAALVLGFINQVNTEQKISRNDTDYSGAFYAAEAGLEKLNSDLSKLFLQSVFPSQDDLGAIQGTAYQPQLDGVTFTGYSLTGGQSTRLNGAITAISNTITVLSTSGWPESGFFMIDAEEMTYSAKTATTFTGVSRGTSSSTAAAHNNNATVFRSKVVTLSEGANAGLNAQTIPFTLDVTAQAGVGTEARLTREVQVALIPVFQFGIFSDSALSFFAGPDFNFGGRVHSNSDIYLAEGSGTLTLSQKVTSASEIIRAELANGHSTSSNYTGTVRVITTPGSYRNLALNEGSVTGGAGSSANSSWSALSLSTYNGNILNETTGGKPLTLPFVAGGYSPIELIKRPVANEDADGLLGQSRLANQASLRVFISDTEANLPTGVGYILDNTLANYNAQDTVGPPAIFRPPFAESNPNDPDFITAAGADETAASSLIGGYIYIDRWNTDGTFTDVTMEILQLGISTNQTNAILRFQKPKWDLLDSTNSMNATDYVPINMYDAREARFRDDNSTVGSNLRKMGIMNLVELDVRKLKDWFAGTIGTTGAQAASNSGYIFYFSDRRGNRDDSGDETGEFGFEDFVNPLDANGTPNNDLDAGEDLNASGDLQTYGANLPYNPFTASTDLYSTSLPVPVAQKAINLTEDLDAAETSFDVSSVTGLSAGYYRIDNEIVNCTSVAASPITCTRAQLGTAAATHVPTQAINLTANVVDTTGTTFTVSSTAGVTTPRYYRIDSETILCTTVLSGTTLTCERGKLGTTAATHSSVMNAGATTNITSGAVTITLTANTGFPTAGAWYRVDNETMYCTRAANTLTCTRGALGTAAAAHGTAAVATTVNVNSTTTTFTFASTASFTVPNYYRIENEAINCTTKTATTMTCTRAAHGTAAASHTQPKDVVPALSANVANTTTTSFTFTSTTSITVPAYYKFDNEIVSCGSKTATVLTCTRAQLGTAAATHSAGVGMVNVFTIGLVNVQPVNIFTSERSSKNRVHYFRRALRLYNGASPNLPTPGFTVAAENPIYVMGNYNSDGTANFADSHSYAAVIGDAVSLLSNNWVSGGDERSFTSPYTTSGRTGTTTWYRMAIASGKGINFTRPDTEDDQDFGTDGGTHNFLRYLESWSGATANYRGSIVSLYYYRQAIGPYKCCDTVYGPPTRAYAFDTDFLVPSQLPPGTPRFRDINNLAFRQTIRADN